MKLNEQSLSYAGPADFSLQATQDAQDIFEPFIDGFGSVCAFSLLAGSSTSCSQFLPGGNVFSSGVQTDTSGGPFFLRQADLVTSWLFHSDSDTTYDMGWQHVDGVCAGFQWLLTDLTSNQIVDSDSQCGVSGGGGIRSGVLLSGHHYSLLTHLFTWGSSDESVSLVFDVGSSVIVPEPATFGLLALGLLGLTWKRKAWR